MTAPASLVAKLLEQTEEQTHPRWCTGATDPAPCDSHFSEPTTVPATFGDHVSIGQGALFPEFDVTAVRNADGDPGVIVELGDPTCDGQVRRGSLEARLTASEAHRLGTALIEAARLARQS